MADSGEPETVVKMAKNREKTDHILELLKTGVDPDETDHQGMTALHWAAKTGNEPLVRGLIDAKADIHTPDMHGNSPLFYAVLKHSSPIVKFLLEAGADPSQSRKNGITPLHISAGQNYKEIVKLLVAYGAECNAQKSSGETPLHVSVDNASIELVNCLIEGGADPGIRLPSGETALHLLATAIVHNRNPANLNSRIDIMVELLQSCTVDYDQGETPLDIIAKDFVHSNSLDLVSIVKTFLEMKLKPNKETFDNIIYGIIKRSKHYVNTLPIVLPYLDPKLLVIHSVKPLAIDVNGQILSFFHAAATSQQSWRQHALSKAGKASGSEQFLRLSRMLCEVGCVPPNVENIDSLPEDEDEETDLGLIEAEKERIMEAVSVWKGYAKSGPSLQTLARNEIRRAMINLKQETFHRLPVPSWIRDYVAMSELRNLEY